MKKKWYRSGFIKAVAILLSYVIFVTAAFGAVMLFQMSRAGVDLYSDGDFTKSWNYKNLVYDNGYRIENELRIKILKDTLSQYSDGETIDVGAFYSGNVESVLDVISPLEEDKSGLEYEIQDLIAWAGEEREQGYDGYQRPLLRCQKEDGTYYYFYYEEFLQGLSNGRISCELNRETKLSYFGEREDGGFLNNYPREEIEAFLTNTAYSNQNIGKIIVNDTGKQEEYKNCYPLGDYNANLLNPTTQIGELYSPKGYDNLLDFLNQNTDVWNDKVNMAYDALDKVLLELGAYYNGTHSYNTELEAYQDGKTNVTYLYADMDQKKIYTNEKTYEDYTRLERTLEEMKKDSFVILPSKGEKLSNIEDFGEANMLGAMEHHADYISDAQDYVFALQIDTDFSADDKLAQASRIYQMYAGKLRPILILEVICAVIWLLLIIYLTMTAGRVAGDEELHLNGFDRIYTEIGALLTGGVWFVGIMMALSIYFPAEELQMMFVWAFCVGLFTQALFLTGWLSLVRRIKAKTLWKNSICRILCRWISKALRKIMGLWKKIWHRILDFFYGRDIILDGLKRISGGETQYKIPTARLSGKRQAMAEYINNIGSGLDAAVDKAMRSERMKTDLITNVSHDIKTPLTSIINYVDLLKRENFTDPKIQSYLQILDEKSQRLKILTEDVVEASKASSGNINLEITELDFVELIHQVLGEFEEKFEEKNLTMIVHFEDEASVIRADGQRMWRVLSNIFGNVVKYAMEGTRVYAEVSDHDQKVIFTLKNISAQPLNISADELTERFIRGDISRNTEGSGLGLSIAKSLTELQGGEFKLFVDGDLFKVVITFVAVEKK